MASHLFDIWIGLFVPLQTLSGRLWHSRIEDYSPDRIRHLVDA